MTMALVKTTPDKRQRVTEPDMRKIVTMHQPPQADAFAELDLAIPRFEEALIGLVLNDNALFSLLRRIVQPQDFFIVFNGTLWAAMERLSDNDAGINPLTLLDELAALTMAQGKQATEAITEHEIIRVAEAAASVPSNITPEYVARRVREASAKRRILTASHEIAALVLKRATPIDTLIAESNRILFRATEQDMRRGTSVADGYASLYDKLEYAIQHPDEKRVLPTYLVALDELIDGLAPGELTIIAGNAGMGKTAALMTLVYNLLAHDKSVVYFALEMTREEVTQILISMITGIPKQVMRSGALTQRQWGDFVLSAKTIEAWRDRLHIFDKLDYPQLKPTNMRTELRYLQDARGMDISAVFVDGLWLMEADEPTDNRPRDVYHVTRAMTDFADEFDCPVVMAQQYNRDFKGRSKKDKRPKLSDLAEAASVERNADLIIALHRDSYYKIASVTDLTEMHLLKVRNGNPDAQGQVVSFKYDTKHSMLTNIGKPRTIDLGSL